VLYGSIVHVSSGGYVVLVMFVLGGGVCYWWLGIWFGFLWIFAMVLHSLWLLRWALGLGMVWPGCALWGVIFWVWGGLRGV